MNQNIIKYFSASCRAWSQNRSYKIIKYVWDNFSVRQKISIHGRSANLLGWNRFLNLIQFPVVFCCRNYWNTSSESLFSMLINLSNNCFKLIAEENFFKRLLFSAVDSMKSFFCWTSRDDEIANPSSLNDKIVEAKRHSTKTRFKNVIYANYSSFISSSFYSYSKWCLLSA